MCPIQRNSHLVHVALPQILGTNGLVVVVVVFVGFFDVGWWWDGSRNFEEIEFWDLIGFIECIVLQEDS